MFAAAQQRLALLLQRRLQAKAQLYARALGVQLGGVRSLSEGGGYTPPSPPMPVAMFARAQMADSTPVSAGEMSVRIDVNGVYDIVR